MQADSGVSQQQAAQLANFFTEELLDGKWRN
jgi:hypothetical protein